MRSCSLTRPFIHALCRPASWHVACAVWLSVVVVSARHATIQAGEDTWTIRQLREPTALAISPDGDLLYVANRQSGSISVVDLDENRVIGETAVGRRLSDLSAAPHGRLLATDEAGHQLVVLEVEGATTDIKLRHDVSEYPVSVTVSRDGSWCSVASLWSRRLTFVSLPATPDTAVQASKVIDLPFAPRAQLLVKGDALLLVADAFGGRLGVVDVAESRLLSVQDLGVHNIRGLRQTSDGRSLVLTHQRLEVNVPTTQDDIHWGRFISNAVFWLDINAVIDGRQDVYVGAQVSAIDREARGAGDPAGLDVARDGTTVVALAGVSQVAVSGAYGPSYQRVDVGQRPTAVVLSPDAQTAYIANTFGESISVVDLSWRQETHRISLGSRPELTLAQEGERLFYDATLSHDGWMSCHSCHTDGHTSGRLADTLGDGSFGTPKGILSLLGVRDTAPYAWNGSRAKLEDQIRSSIRTTMHADYAQRRRLTSKVEALAGYLRSLDPPPSVAAARGEGSPTTAARGKEVFAEVGCARCHVAPALTSPHVHDVGIIDEKGHSRFNPPSLRGLSQRSSFLHDGTAASPEEVVGRLRHPQSEDISQEQLEVLLAYLRNL